MFSADLLCPGLDFVCIVGMGLGMALAFGHFGGLTMQATYEESIKFRGADDFAPEDTRDIPFFGFVTGSLISLGLWCIIAWTVWALVD